MSEAIDRLFVNYKRFGFSTPEDHVKAVQVAIKGDVKNLSPEGLPLVAKVAFGIARPTDLSDFAQSYKSDALDIDGKDAEIPLIAASVIAAVTEDEQGIAPLAALVMVTAGMGGLSKPKFDVASLDHYRSVLANKQRQIDAKPAPKGAKPTMKYADLLERLVPTSAENNLGALYPELKKIIEGGFKFSESVSSTAAAQLNDVVSYLSKNQEQMDVHWWVLGNWCNWLDQSFPAMAPIDRAACAAKDLADLSTHSRHGIFPAQAMLARVLPLREEDEVLPIKKVITGLTTDVRQKLLASVESNTVSTNLLPTLLAVRESLDAEDAEDWEPRFKRLCGVDPEAQVSLADFSHQLYLELVLERLL
jgi:hypothetical protein